MDVSLRARDTCVRYCSRARGMGLSLCVCVRVCVWVCESVSVSVSVSVCLSVSVRACARVSAHNTHVLQPIVLTRAAGTVPPANERLLRLTSLRTLNPLEARIGLGKEKYMSPQHRILVGGRVERR